MATAHDRIPPLQVANLPPAAATLGPFAGALDAAEPGPRRSPLRREAADVGHVQRPWNQGVPSASAPPAMHLGRDHRPGTASSLSCTVRPITAGPGEPIVKQHYRNILDISSQPVRRRCFALAGMNPLNSGD
jgi:hypothetical protein